MLIGFVHVPNVHFHLHIRYLWRFKYLESIVFICSIIIRYLCQMFFQTQSPLVPATECLVDAYCV
jgi:hypothetical protein